MEELILGILAAKAKEKLGSDGADRWLAKGVDVLSEAIPEIISELTTAHVQCEQLKITDER